MTDDHIFEIDFGPNIGKKAFRTVDEVRQFVRSERDFWNWLGQGQMGGNEGAQRVWNIINYQFQTLTQNVDGWAAQRPTNMDVLLGAFRQVFVSARVPLSDSPLGCLIEGLRHRRDDAVAAAALAFEFNQSPIPNGLPWLIGGAELAAFKIGVSPTSAESTLASLKAIRAEFSDELTQNIEAGNAQRQAHAKMMSQQARRADVQKRWIARGSRRQMVMDQSAFDKAITEFQETNKLFREQMRLKAPVDYWNAKAEEHSTAAKQQRNRLLIYSIIATILILAVLSSAAIFAEKIITKETPFGVLGLYAAIGITLTTVLLWAGRIMVRLYLSEHHLALDARERAVMAQTYLALTAVERADEKDRALVLAALFRSSTDGVVKDDGAPDIGFASLASKVISR